MSVVISDEKNYKAIALKIRRILNTNSLYKPSEMPQAIAQMKNVMDECSSIQNGIIYKGEKTAVVGTKIYAGSFSELNIKSYIVPENVTEILDYAFANSKIKNLILHNNISSLGKCAFYGCDNLFSIDIPENISSLDSTFAESGMAILILRRTSSICSTDDKNVLRNTPISDGEGYIYVPSALLDSYKTATGWSTYANQFRILEEYTTDGTVTGKFNYAKI